MLIVQNLKHKLWHSDLTFLPIANPDDSFTQYKPNMGTQESLWFQTDILTTCICSQKNAPSVSILGRISCRFRPDQLMNQWQLSTNAATPSVDTDGETETFALYFLHALFLVSEPIFIANRLWQLWKFSWWSFCLCRYLHTVFTFSGVVNFPNNIKLSFNEESCSDFYW